MKVSELISFVDIIKPNAFPVSAKVAWLNEVEGMVWTEVMLLSPLEFVPHTYDDSTGEGDADLLVVPPHSKLYNTYLCAMIDFANGEYDKYQNTMTLFNAHFSEFMRWYATHYRPADGDFGYMGIYISAYGIAVKHGFVGTEEEWIDSLKAAVDEEMVRAFVEAYLEANPLDAPVTSVNGKTGDVELTAADVGALDSSTLSSAVDDALTQAKESGEFDGKDGASGVGIREVKQTTTSTVSGGKNVITVYLTDGTSHTFTVYNGQKGADGTGGGSGGTGTDGVSVTGAEVNDDGYLLITLSTGEVINAGYVVGADGNDGDKGDKGTDGVGISSVEQTTTSTADGGTNKVTVTLTDGTSSTFQFKNGSKGSTGPGIGNVERISGTGAAGTTDTYEITLDDGSGTVVGTFQVYNGADGQDGTDGTGGSGSGERGSKIFYVDYPQFTSVSGTIGNVNPSYSLPISTLTAPNPNIGAPLAGDVVLHENSKVYAVLLVKDDTVYLDEAVNIKGDTGERGSKILKTTTRPSSSTVDWDDGLRTYLSIHVDYLNDDTGVTSVKNNDVVWYDTYFYSVARVEDNIAYLTHGVDLKGSGDGSAGQDGVSVTDAEVDGEGFLQITLSTGEVINAGYVMGEDGYTPVKGTDYWTENDKAEIVSDVLAALPTWEGGSY